MADALVGLHRLARMEIVTSLRCALAAAARRQRQCWRATCLAAQ
jgi:hypothetical protein